MTQSQLWGCWGCHPHGGEGGGTGGMQCDAAVFFCCLYTHPLALVRHLTDPWSFLDNDNYPSHQNQRGSLLCGVLSCHWARTGRTMALSP